jgi:hypothetical protein
MRLFMSTTEQRIITVATQNVLLDYRRTKEGLILPQDDRISSVAATLENFGEPFDAVGIQEAHKSRKQHNGKVLSNLLGYGDGFWVQHNEKPETPQPGRLKGRPDEYMGIFGKSVEWIEPIDLGDNRTALMTKFADIVFVTLHLRSGAEARHLRLQQAERLTDALDEHPDTVLALDLNDPTIPFYSLARPHLTDAGFESVFTLTGQRRPKTSPTRPYKRAAMNGRGWRAPFVGVGWSIDDILVRGPRIQVLAAGVLRQVIDPAVYDAEPLSAPRMPTDHLGEWARLRIMPKID